MNIKNILVPIDFSADSEAALDWAMDLAKDSGAQIHLLHAHQPITVGASMYGVGIPLDYDQQLREAASKRLAEWSTRVSENGLKASSELVLTPPTDAITHAAKDLPADLIVIGTRGLSGLSHLLMGSVAERTVRLAHCPVVTVKNKAADES